MCLPARQPSSLTLLRPPKAIILLSDRSNGEQNALVCDNSGLACLFAGGRCGSVARLYLGHVALADRYRQPFCRPDCMYTLKNPYETNACACIMAGSERVRTLAGLNSARLGQDLSGQQLFRTGQ